MSRRIPWGALRLATLSLILTVALSAMGCAIAPQRSSRIQVVHVGGHKLNKNRPHPHAVWVKGHYAYRNGRYAWVPGHWRRP